MRKTAALKSTKARKATRLSTRKAVTSAVEMLETRQLMTTTFKIGLGVNDGSSSFMNAATGKMQSLGVQSVRLYLSANFNSPAWSGVMQRAIDYSNRGFDVMLCVTPQSGNVYSTSAVTNWFQWAMGNSALKGAVDRWEIGNEPDHSNYWKGSLSQYVTQLLEPAYNVLHANGEEVVSAGPSWDTQDVQEMINAGMLNYTDYVGYHPYATGVKMVEQRLSEIQAVVQGRKPLVASEWNVRGLEGNAAAWSAADQQVYQDIVKTFAINYYYAAEKVSTPAGPAGLMYNNGAANQPFYNMFATFESQSANITPGSYMTNPTGTTTTTGSTTTTGTTTTGTTTTGTTTTGTTTTGTTTTGTTTAAGGTGSISGTLFNDDDNDGVYDSNENVTGARTVFIDTDGDGVLDNGEVSVTSAANGTFKFSGLAAGKYNVTRVFPAGYHLGGTTAKDISVTVNAGQQVTGLNIGTSNKTVTTTTTPTTGTTTTTTTPTTPTVPSGVIVSATGPSFSNLRFVDKNGNAIAGLSNVTTDRIVSLASLSTLDIAVVAVASGYSQSAQLVFNGATTIDNQLGYTFLPETNSVYTTFHVTKGTYTFSATAFTGTNATGTAGLTKSYTITFN